MKLFETVILKVPNDIVDHVLLLAAKYDMSIEELFLELIAEALDYDMFRGIGGKDKKGKAG